MNLEGFFQVDEALRGTFLNFLLFSNFYFFIFKNVKSLEKCLAVPHQPERKKHKHLQTLQIPAQNQIYQ